MAKAVRLSDIAKKMNVSTVTVSKALSGQDSLLSIVQMPGGVPVGTLAIGKPGAINAALIAGNPPEKRVSQLRALRQVSQLARP